VNLDLIPARARNPLFLTAIAAGAVAFGQLVSVAFSPQHDLVPLPVQLQALATGCPAALFALGVVLIYRSNRIINFAQTAFGGAGAIAALAVMRTYDIPWHLSMLFGLLVAAALGATCEILLIRRFAKSTRLVLTVVTIGVAQLVTGIAGPLLSLLGVEADELQSVLERADSPFTQWTVEWFPVTFSGDHLALAIVTAVAVAGLGMFFRFTRVGIAVRAAAENVDRAELLGVNTRTLATLVWVLAAVLSGVAALLQLPFQGVGDVAAVGVGSGLLLRGLAAAVFGRFDNLPAVFVAALALNVFEQSVFFAVGQRDIITIALFAVLLIGLLAQRKQLARAQSDESGSWASTEEIRPVPPELSPLPEVRTAARWTTVILAVLVLGYPWVGSTSQVNLGGLFAIYGIVAVSLVILIGWGGQISLGHWSLAAVGALVGGSLTARYGWPFLPALLVASLAGAGVAILLGLPALRIRGLFLAVTTLAFSLLVSDILLNERYFGWLLPKTINRPHLLFLNGEDERVYYYVCVAGLAFAVFCALGLRNSRTGRVLIAMRDNERTAQALGVNLVRTRLATFALSGFLAAFAGALYAHHQHVVLASSFTPDQSIQMFLMAVIGGLGSVVGVLAGPVYLGLFSTFLTSVAFLASATGVLVVMVVFPSGLGGLVFAIRDAFLRRVAIRHRLFVPSLLADYLVDGQLERVPVVPEKDADGNAIEAPVRYRLPSRIETAGHSQVLATWKA
jgi:branched-chain amino acid transport system permease protein